MISVWRYIGWPLALVNGARVVLRNHLFNLGVWKSVEFQMPVIFVGSLANDPTAGLSFYISQLLKGALHIHKGNLSQYKLKVDEENSGYYYTKLRNQLTSNECFTTRHKVLGLSEWFQQAMKTEVVVMDREFGKSEIRPHMRILVTNYDTLFLRNTLWPVGSLHEPKQEATQAHILLVCQTPQDADLQKTSTEIRRYLNSESSVFYIKNSSDSLKTFNSSDKIEFIQDRDNFERLIMNVLSNAVSDSE